MLLLLIGFAAAHGSRFGVTALSVAPGDTREIWGVADGWGLIHSVDGGLNWEWTCEEAIGTSSVYAAVAIGPDEVLLATGDGVQRLGPGCVAPAVLPGLPEGAQAGNIVAFQEGFLVTAFADEVAGLWSCTREACIDTSLQGPAWYTKSVVVDGGVGWATMVEGEDLSATLHRTTDGIGWEEVLAWGPGAADYRVLHADGDRLLVWRQARDQDEPPALIVSEDGGLTWAVTLATGTWTDPVPALVVVPNGAGEVLYLGTDVGRTFRSDDGGHVFVDVSSTSPVMRCAAPADDTVLVCTDHFADGFDMARADGDGVWAAIGCLDDALPSACVADACDTYLEGFVAGGAYGGGECYTTSAPAPGVPGCGCGDGSAAAMVGVLVGLGRRRRQGPRSR